MLQKDTFEINKRIRSSVRVQFGLLLALIALGGLANVGLASEIDTKQTDGSFAGFLPPQYPLVTPTFAGTGVALGDFDRDGVTDLALADISPSPFGEVQVMLGVGDGTFGPPSGYPVGTDVFAVETGDFNLDGILDLATLNHTTEDVSVLLGNGDGTFQPESFFSVGSEPEELKVADVDGDGIPDVVTTNQASDSVSVLVGDGTGMSFAKTDYPTDNTSGQGNLPRDFVLDDLNNDGSPDIALLTVDQYLVVLYNVGDGTFFTGDFALYFPTGEQFSDLVSVDADQDGWLDLVVLDSPGDSLVVFTNNVDAAYPTFSTGPPISVVDTPSSVATGDVNLDGVSDLAITGSFSNLLQVLLGDGIGGYAPAGSWPTQNSPISLAVGDLDRDGDDDVVVPALNYGLLTILLNGTTVVGGPAPEAVLASPVHLGCQCGVEEVLGVADVGSGMFDRWDLEYRATSDDTWIPLAESDIAVPSPGGVLTNWDTTLLAEGRYLLRLTVTSLSGLTATDEVVVWVSRDFDVADYDFLWGNVGLPAVATVVAGNACPIGTVTDGGCGGVSYTLDYSTLGGGSYTPIDPGNPTYPGGRINTALAVWDTIGTSIPDGDYDVRLVGLNACGHQALAFRTVRVDNTPPMASFEAPISCLVAHPGDAVEIRGTASDANLLSWSVSVVGGPYSSWHTLASGGASVVNGLLATLDTTGLPDCGYVLRLRVTDAAIPNCGSSPRDVIVYRAFGIGTNGCMFGDPFEIGGTGHWDSTVPTD